MTVAEAWNFAEHWLSAWNAHDLTAILSHYNDNVELTSPVAARLLGTPHGKVVGKEDLRAYFQRGLDAFPQLHFQLQDVLCGINRLCCTTPIRQAPTPLSSWNFPNTAK